MKILCINKLSNFKLTFPQFKGKGIESYNYLLSKMLQLALCKRIILKLH